MSKSDNLINFPKNRQNTKDGHLPDVTHYYRGKVRRSTPIVPVRFSLGLVSFVFKSARFLLFNMLLWLRPLVFVVLQPVSGISLLACLAAILFDAHDDRLKYGFGLIGFGSFMVMMLYDNLLMALSGGNVVNVLN